MAVPGDTGSFLLILGMSSRLCPNDLAVMTSVSEFIGFLVIQVFPGQTLKHSWSRRVLYRPKVDEPSLSGDESPDDISDEAARILPSEDRQHAPTSIVAQPVLPLEPSSRPALRNPDFWTMAIIMSMRTLLLRF